jgi:hypothetical protein
VGLGFSTCTGGSVEKKFAGPSALGAQRTRTRTRTGKSGKRAMATGHGPGPGGGGGAGGRGRGAPLEIGNWKASGLVLNHYHIVQNTRAPVIGLRP